jgi:hypothetical protein
MAFNGKYYTVDFDSIRNLMRIGTDIIVVEKFGTVIKITPVIMFQNTLDTWLY